MMAANGAQQDFSPQNVLSVMATMRGGEAQKKETAMDLQLSEVQGSQGSEGIKRHLLASARSLQQVLKLTE